MKRVISDFRIKCNPYHPFFGGDSICPPRYTAPMANQGKMRGELARWVAAGLKKPGKTQAGLAKAMGIGQSRIPEINRGERAIKAHEIPLIAAYLDEPPPRFDHLGQMIPIVGYVGAGAVVYPVVAHETGDGIDMIEAPPGMSDGIALIVRGDSMYPRYMDGDIITCRAAEHDPARLVGKTCYVELADGRAYLKILQRGRTPGLWTLASHNAPPIEEVEVVRLWPVDWVKHRD